MLNKGLRKGLSIEQKLVGTLVLARRIETGLSEFLCRKGMKIRVCRVT